MPPDDRFTSHLALFFGALFGCSVLFLAAPQIDLAVSGLFYEPGKSFPLNRNPVMQGLRHVFQISYSLIILISLVLLIANLWKTRAPHLPGRFHVWVLGSFAIGAGAIVNLALKSHWGRARPALVEPFGGPLEFTPPLLMTDQCPRNCAFSSGEGAAITVAAITLAVLFMTGRDRGWRQIILGIAIAGGTIGAGLRIIMGRHFLSDTLFSALICGLVCLVLYRLLRLGDVRDQITWRNLMADIKSLRPTKVD